MTRRERPTSSPIPKAAAGRLSLYLRYLESLQAEGVATTSSEKLGEALGVTAAQVRKDLGYIGHFGLRGVGYKIAHLIPRIRTILGTDRTWKVALVGIGNLGSALVQYRGFARQGFQFAALFDRREEIVGTSLGGLTVLPIASLSDVVREREIELAVMAVPADAAQEVADELVAAGIRGIFNFAPTVVTVPDGVAWVSIDLSIQLEQLSFAATHSVDRPTDPGLGSAARPSS